jgi:hypothetical protein
MKTKSCNIATADFIRQVESIPPSNTGSWGMNKLHYPCAMILKDGSRLERVICVEDHRGFTTDGWIHPDEVVRIEKSPLRMPARLATKLYEAGESGMGYEIFKMVTRSAGTIVYVTGNIVDFPDLPDGVNTLDIVDVLPHEGRNESKTSYRQGAPFKWCFYVKE